MKFDEKSDARSYLETIGQDLYGEIKESFDEMVLSTITKNSLFTVETSKGVNMDIQKEEVHKMVREGVYWQYYVKNRMGKWMKG